MKFIKTDHIPVRITLKTFNMFSVLFILYIRKKNHAVFSS